MNRYEYKIVNTDSRFTVLKRMVLYVVLPVSVITTALVVLFIVFELYFRLFICAALYLLCFLISFFMRRKPDEYSYSFDENNLTISFKNEVKAIFRIEKLVFVKNAENSDYFSKNIIKFAFVYNKIIIKNALSDDNCASKCYVVKYDNAFFLTSFDDYAISIIKGVSDENMLF